jgi:hypothetical protein
MTESQDQAPWWWWRPYWGAATAVTLGLMLIHDDYSLLVPAIVGYASACFGDEYVASRST